MIGLLEVATVVVGGAKVEMIGGRGDVRPGPVKRINRDRIRIICELVQK